MTEWWTNQDAGLIGGLGGSAVGILGGLIGVFAGIFARKGAMKTAVLAMMGLLVFACVVSLIVGVVAVTLGQPYHVWYPLTLLGSIGTIVGGSLFPVVLNVYRQADHRRFEAEQLRRA